MKEILTKADILAQQHIYGEEIAYMRELEPGFDDLPQEVYLEDITGGSYYLVESEEDLLKINDILPDSYRSLMHHAFVFDSAEISKDGKYVSLFQGFNDSGGPVYHVPREIAERCPTVLQSVKMTNDYWDSIANQFFKGN